MTSASPTAKERSGSGGTFVSNFCIAVRLRGEFSLEQLQQALDSVRVRHRLLVPGAEDTRFPLRLLTGEEDHVWKEAVREELRTGFAGSGPFARFTWLQGADRSDLIGTFHHGVCDGFSGVYVLRDVLQALGDPDAPVVPLSPPAPLATRIPESLRASPYIQRQIRRRVNGMRLTLLLERVRRVLPTPRPLPAQPAVSAPGELPPSLRMCILTRTLTAAQTARLVECARAEGTTVHSAVCTAWLRAFAATLPATESRIRSVSSPVSLRNRLTTPVDETSGMFMSTANATLDCQPSRDFWEMAREFQASFTGNASDEKLFLMPLMFGAFARSFSSSEMASVVRNFFQQQVTYDFSITNLGRLDFPAQVGSLRIESFHNLVNSSELERTVNVNTFDSRLTFNFVFRESRLAPPAGEQLLAQAVRQLADATSW